MRILLLATAFNSLSQRVYVELEDLDHDVICSVVSDGDEKAFVHKTPHRLSGRPAAVAASLGA